MLATDMAEFLGVVVALRLLFGLGLPSAVVVGALIVLGLLAAGDRRRRGLEFRHLLAPCRRRRRLRAGVVLAAPGTEVVTGLVTGRMPPGALAVPALVVLALGVGEITALVWSQVVLCIVLPANAWPLLRLTSDPELMGGYPNRRRTRVVGGVLVTALFCLNVLLVTWTFR